MIYSSKSYFCSLFGINIFVWPDIDFNYKWQENGAVYVIGAENKFVCYLEMIYTRLKLSKIAREMIWF